VKVPADKVGHTNVVSVALAFDDVATHSRVTRQVAVGVDVSADAVAVNDAVNKTVAAATLEVESADALRQAAEAYDRGDAEGAQALNRAARHKAARTAGVLGLAPAATAGMFDDLDEQNEEMEANEPGSEAAKASVKMSKARARSMTKKKR